MAVILDIWHPSHPADVSGLEVALAALPLERVSQLAVLGKVEGPASINDFARDLAAKAVDEVILRAGGERLMERTWRLFSTGCEGIASPVGVLLANVEAPANAGPAPRLTFGAARSASLVPAELCGLPHVRHVAQTVCRACKQARLRADQVALILVKSPVLSVEEAFRLGAHMRRHGGSTGSSRGAGALGAALALGEIDESSLNGDPLGLDPRLYARRAMVYSGTETDAVEVVVLGERPGVGGTLRIAGGLMSDMLDRQALDESLQALGDSLLRLVFFKAGSPPDGRLRGRRTTLLSSELPTDKQLRAAASGIVGAWFPDADAFISGGAEHQGPPGASLFALIANAGEAGL